MIYIYTYIPICFNSIHILHHNSELWVIFRCSVLVYIILYGIKNTHWRAYENRECIDKKIHWRNSNRGNGWKFKVIFQLNFSVFHFSYKLSNDLFEYSISISISFFSCIWFQIIRRGRMYLLKIITREIRKEKQFRI